MIDGVIYIYIYIYMGVRFGPLAARLGARARGLRPADSYTRSHYSVQHRRAGLLGQLRGLSEHHPAGVPCMGMPEPQ